MACGVTFQADPPVLPSIILSISSIILLLFPEFLPGGSFLPSNDPANRRERQGGSERGTMGYRVLDPAKFTRTRTSNDPGGP